MSTEKMLMFGGVAVLAIAAYLGANSVLKASALENERIDGINKARSIAVLVSQDEATFGTSFRDAAMACASESTDAKLPNAVWEHYVAVTKSAITLAADENYSPRNNKRWFVEARRQAETENPLPDTALAKLDPAAKKEAEEALTNISSNIDSIGECLVQAAQK